jgi:hypothetical protein
MSVHFQAPLRPAPAGATGCSPGRQPGVGENKESPRAPKGRRTGEGAQAPQQGEGLRARARGRCRRPLGAWISCLSSTRGRRACGAPDPGLHAAAPSGLKTEICVMVWAEAPGFMPVPLRGVKTGGGTFETPSEVKRRAAPELVLSLGAPASRRQVRRNRRNAGLCLRPCRRPGLRPNVLRMPARRRRSQWPLAGTSGWSYGRCLAEERKGEAFASPSPDLTD